MTKLAKLQPTITKDTDQKKLIKFGKQCKRCGNCCSYGSGFVLDKEIPEISKKLNLDEKEFKEKYLEEITKFNTTLHRFKLIRDNMPYGKCIFLNEQKKCSIHDIKPLHCRITTCSEHGKDINDWFILNHFVNKTDPQSIREWNTRLKVNKTIKGGEIESLIPNKELRDNILDYNI